MEDGRRGSLLRPALEERAVAGLLELRLPDMRHHQRSGWLARVPLRSGYADWRLSNLKLPQDYACWQQQGDEAERKAAEPPS